MSYEILPRTTLEAVDEKGNGFYLYEVPPDENQDDIDAVQEHSFMVSRIGDPGYSAGYIPVSAIPCLIELLKELATTHNIEVE